MSSSMLFSGWPVVGRTVVVGILAYLALVLLLRASGKRTLSKLNAFDLVVTVALGSTLASVLVSKDVSLAQGLVALVLLVSLQFTISFASVRWPLAHRLVRSEPKLLVYRGRAIACALRDERISREEVESAIRSAGLGSFDETGAVVLETDGSLSVTPRGALVSDDSSVIPDGQPLAERH